MWWVDPSEQPNTHSASGVLPSLVDWGENRRKVERLVTRDHDSVIRKAKTAPASETEREIHLPLSIRRQMSSYVLGSSRQHVLGLFGKANAINTNVPSSSSFFPPVFVAEHNVMWFGMSLCSLGVSCP